MTIQSGYFDAIDYDRRYSADDMNHLFDGVLSEGVFQGLGDSLMVSEASNNDLSVLVGSGRAWFNRSFLTNDGSVNVFTEQAHISLDRIDTLVMDFNKEEDVRTNAIFFVTGTPDSKPEPPELINTAYHKQIPIADVLISAEEDTIFAEDIENRIGTSDCPFAHGLLEQLDSSVLLGQWSAIFWNWFNNLDDNLSENALTNLQQQIDDITPIPMSGRNLLINGDMSTNQPKLQSKYVSYNSANVNGLFAGPDRWGLYAQNAGSGNWPTILDHNTELISESVRRDVCRVRRSDYDGTIDPLSQDTYLYVAQHIEARNLKSLLKGAAGEKELTLSFIAYSSQPGMYVIEVVDYWNDRHFTYQYSIPFANSPVEVEFTIPIDQEASDFPYQDYEDSLEAAMSINFWLMAGSDYTSGTALSDWEDVYTINRAAGLTTWGSVNDEFWFTNVQLEVGSNATSFEHLPVEENLIRCQRYYESGRDSYMASVIRILSIIGIGSAPQIAFLARFKTRKRTQDPLTWAVNVDAWEFSLDGASFVTNEATSTDESYLWKQDSVLFVIEMVSSSVASTMGLGDSAFVRFEWFADDELRTTITGSSGSPQGEPQGSPE